MVVRYMTDANSDGTIIGKDSSETVGFYGATPVAQRAAEAQATSNISASAASFGTVHLAALKEIMNTLAAVGLWKGSA